MNTMLDNEIIIGKDFYLWKNARIYFQYDEKIDGYCLFDAYGFADDLFIPQDINGIQIKCIYGEEFYNGLTSYEKVVVSENNQNFITIDGILFSHNKKRLILYPPNKKATAYTVPASVNTISSCSFSYNEYLEKIDFQNGVESINDYALAWCKNLLQVTLPQSIKSIGHKAFLGVDKLLTVQYGGCISDWQNIYISDINNDALKTAMLLCQGSIGES